MEEPPISSHNDGPSDRHRLPFEPGLVIVMVLSVAAVVFAVAAWWPGGRHVLGLGEGLLTVGFGVLLVAVPTVIAVAVFSEARLVWLKFLVVVPFAVIAMFVGFIWTAIINFERSDMGWH